MKKFFILLSILSITIVSNAQTSVPSVSLKDINGKTVNVQELSKNGKVTIFCFWAVWCKPCMTELDKLSSLMADWQKKYNVQLIAVSIDDAKSTTKVKPTVAGKKWKCDNVLLDINQQLMRAFNVTNPPFAFIVDKTGKVVFKHNGYVPGDEKEMEEALKKL